VTVQPAKKFYVFHQRHFWKSANVQEGSSPAEQPVIAASHSEQNACVMRKGVGQSINEASRQANPEVTADDSWVVYDACNLIQTSLRNFGIDMEEPKHIALRSTRARIHLHRPIALAQHELITKSRGKVSRSIRASAIRNNNLSFGCSLAKMPKEWLYQQRLIKHRNNDRELWKTGVALVMADGAPASRGIVRSHFR